MANSCKLLCCASQDCLPRSRNCHWLCHMGSLSSPLRLRVGIQEDRILPTLNLFRLEYRKEHRIRTPWLGFLWSNAFRASWTVWPVWLQPWNPKLFPLSSTWRIEVQNDTVHSEWGWVLSYQFRFLVSWSRTRSDYHQGFWSWREWIRYRICCLLACRGSLWLVLIVLLPLQLWMQSSLFNNLSNQISSVL